MNNVYGPGFFDVTTPPGPFLNPLRPRGPGLMLMSKRNAEALRPGSLQELDNSPDGSIEYTNVNGDRVRMSLVEGGGVQLEVLG